ncbi:O-acetylhomoserine aminocarboxypropyltransferase [Christensenella minuta]|uniref:O-acetylhomoserine aminocarboxypropyltransferase n=1 Tax=Christensenella minuta TaxID=626937 RepID=A0A136Q1P0_9FIRM|nr:PLP-dependent transferase [Christensenella minuta]AYH40380.1 bifunctional O-acetylhomoserine aminocarboxypropyltransferase/cysteine synthase [Christensenella minuta]KXK64612.1 O-acetylhomoserine aminocarboxypropyltransferase [Christensenella minuta]OAQ37272.1 O-acetylhomoserine aminocarboxypropyltransferase [Christensenella minuta]
MKIKTKCLHEGWKPKDGEPHALPIYQSTTFNYDSTEHIGDLFDLKAAGYFYTRLANPTAGYVEEKLAALEGGVGAMCTSSGQAANMIAVLNIMGAGDHMVCASEVYGGTINLFGVTMEKLGIECTFVNQDAPDDEIEKAFRPNTKLVFGETVANPAISVFDIERFANLAHRHGVPLVVDNTFATPVLCRPFEFGADIVTHSTSKYMDGHAVQLGGVLIDGGTFDWKDYPGLTEPDESYHGVVYTETFGRQAYITKARTQLMRDIGASPTAHAAFLLNLGLETLALRMERHSANAQETAEFLAEQPEVEFVNYPGLKGDKYYSLGQKYLPDGASGVISFSLKGGRDAAVKFMDSLEMASNVVHVATVKTCVLHPASETHRQLSDEQLANAGITPGMIRLSVGIEDIDDIIEDLSKGFASIR